MLEGTVGKDDILKMKDIMTGRDIIQKTNNFILTTKSSLMLIIQVSSRLLFNHSWSIGNNVYVAGIPKRITEPDLRLVFSKFGPILDIKVIRDPQTQNSKGFAYILFEKVDDATRAIDGLDNQRVFNDWALRVERAKRAVAY